MCVAFLTKGALNDVRGPQGLKYPICLNNLFSLSWRLLCSLCSLLVHLMQALRLLSEIDVSKIYEGQFWFLLTLLSTTTTIVAFGAIFRNWVIFKKENLINCNQGKRKDNEIMCLICTWRNDYNGLFYVLRSAVFSENDLIFVSLKNWLSNRKKRLLMLKQKLRHYLFHLCSILS